MVAGKGLLFALLAAIFAIATFYGCKSSRSATAVVQLPSPQSGVLIFAKKTGFYHDSIAGSTDTVANKADNKLPKVAIGTLDNSTFFFDKPTAFRYAVVIQGKEDMMVNRENLRVTMKYIPRVASDVPLTGYPQVEEYSYGRNLIAASDCKTCHQERGNPTIPSFMQISEKYWGDKEAVGFLANKIITGGSGVWGEQVMSAHPQLSKADATEIVKYVLSFSNYTPDMEIPQEGTEVLKEHIGSGYEGRYVFTTSYTGKGSTSTSLTGNDVVVLRPSKVEAERADVILNMKKGTTALVGISHRSYFVLKNIDLKDVRLLTYRYSSKVNNGLIEVHIDAADGQLISTASYRSTGAWDKFNESGAAVTDPGGKHDLYFVFVQDHTPNGDLVILDWIKFGGGNEIKVVKKTTTMNKKRPKPAVAKLGTPARRKPLSTDKIPLAQKSLGRRLMAKSDCKACHNDQQKLVGPSFAAIAARYKNQPVSRNSLVDKIRKGGAGNWGQVPMPPHPKLSEKDAMEMITYIFTLKK